jgi:diketogulonate reductase-like aldo/keto reductase
METWKAMEKLIEKGKCLAVGVSNYMKWHLEELLTECSVAPSVNQVEFSPYLYLQELQTFCSFNNILLEAYSPLTKGQKLDDPKLLEIAKKYKKTAAQILIRWALQRDVVVIPKSSNLARIRENADVFDFNIFPEDMIVLDSFHENLRTSWDPTTVP